MPDTRPIASGWRLVAILTFLSRILGMAREILFAAAFGAGGVMSAFMVAFQVPNLFRRLFGEGALSSAFIPIFSEIRERHGDERAGRLAGTVLVAMSIILVVLVLLGEGVTAGLYHFVPPTPRNHLALRLTAIMLPFALFICLVAVMGGLLNVLGHFAAPAFAPSILNIAILSDIAIGWVIPGLTLETRLVIVAWAVVVAGILEIVLQWGVLRHRKFKIHYSLDLRDEAVQRIALLTGPMILGLSVVQINVLMDSLVAWWFVPDLGAPSKLGFAQRLYQFPEGIFLTAIATAIYPQFSLMVAKKDMSGFGESIVRGIRLALFIGVPASIGLIIMREPLVALVYQRGKFTHADTLRTASVLAYYASAVWAYGLQMMLVRAFYALQDSKTPVRIAVGMVGLNFVLMVVLVNVLPEPQERGVALATAICAVIQSAWLARRLARRVGQVHWAGLGSFVVRVSVASAAMAAACWSIEGFLGTHRSIRVLGLLATGTAVFFAASWLMHIPELKELLHLKRRAEPQ